MGDLKAILGSPALRPERHAAWPGQANSANSHTAPAGNNLDVALPRREDTASAAMVPRPGRAVKEPRLRVATA